MNSRRLRLPLTVAALVLMTGCAAEPGGQEATTPTPPSPAARLVDPARFAAAVDAGRRLTINVHVPFEGAIAGTDLSVPFDRIKADQARLPEDRSTPLAIYCRSGSMSATAATELASLGYTDVIELDGGMNAWTEAGLRLLQRRPG